MSNLSINQLKYYSSLQQKKYRNQFKRFLIEGVKMVLEFLEEPQAKYSAIKLLGLEPFLKENKALLETVDCQEISEADLKKLSSLTTPNQVILEIEMPDDEFKLQNIEGQLSIFLEDIRDPGNLGTIIRTADWFGVKTLLCSPNSVDLYNPKVLQASMGSFTRVDLIRIEARDLIKHSRNLEDFELNATQMDGENLYLVRLPEKGIIFFGNESIGLSEHIISDCNRRIAIPSLKKGKGPESLNLSISVGIFLSEFSSRIIRNEN